MLNLLNGKFIVVPASIPMDIDTDLFPLVGTVGNYTIYRNPDAMPWVYTVSRRKWQVKPLWKVLLKGKWICL